MKTAIPTRRYKRSSLEIVRLGGPRSRLIAGQLRMVYQQYDGEIALACECKCEAQWDEISFYVRRSVECPIDEHRAHFLRCGERKLRPETGCEEDEPYQDDPWPDLKRTGS